LHILLTKSEISPSLVQRLSVKGHKVSLFPILIVKKLNIKIVNLKKYTSIIFTSANGVLNLPVVRDIGHLKCFCVGDHTAEVAKQKGFINIYSASGNYNQLKELIFNLCERDKEKFLYVRGEFISHDLEKDFKYNNYYVESLINYTTEVNKIIDQKLIYSIQNKEIDAIFVYSKRAADQLLKIILNFKLGDSLKNCVLNCISISVVNILKRLPWKKIKIFDSGNEEVSLFI